MASNLSLSFAVFLFLVVTFQSSHQQQVEMYSHVMNNSQENHFMFRVPVLLVFLVLQGEMVFLEETEGMEEMDRKEMTA